MRKLFGLALIGLLSLPAAQATAGGVDATGKVGTVLSIPAMNFDVGAKAWFRANAGGQPYGGGYGGGGAAQGGGLGPWYLYWPLEAHFQTPALPQYPYWPQPMAPYGVGIGGGQANPTASGPYGSQGGYTGYEGGYYGNVRQAGYVPSYWYGR